MINNAGLIPQAPLERLKFDEWNRMIDVNIKGVLYGMKSFSGQRARSSNTEPERLYEQ